MRVQNTYPGQVEFRIFRPRNFIVVENWAEKVVIRAARDNFSERRKRAFVRHLAAEGFIPDRYETVAMGRGKAIVGVDWIIERAEPVEVPPARSRLPQVLLSVLFGAGLLLVLMALVVLRLR